MAWADATGCNVLWRAVQHLLVLSDVPGATPPERRLKHQLVKMYNGLVQ